MKNVLSICGAVLFCIGVAMATGVDYNPIQGVYALICMGAASVCFNRADAIGKREKACRTTIHKVYNYKRGSMEDAA